MTLSLKLENEGRSMIKLSSTGSVGLRNEGKRKQAYRRPELIDYGSLAELTRGGAGSVSDVGSKTNPTKAGKGGPSID
jgi:hypothetical protein